MVSENNCKPQRHNHHTAGGQLLGGRESLTRKVRAGQEAPARNLCSLQLLTIVMHKVRAPRSADND